MEDNVMVVEVFCDANMAVLFGKRKVRRIFWKVRRQLLKNKNKNSINIKKHQNLSFQYDPLSYALNFDDAYCGFLCL